MGTVQKTPPGDQVGLLIVDIARLIRTDFFSRTRGTSLTPQLTRLILLINRHPGCRQVQLAEWMDLTPVTLGRMLDRLERQGLIRRAADPNDRRAVAVYVDDKAAPLLRQMQGIGVLTRERALRGMAAPDRKRLVATLEAIRDNLLADDVQPPKQARVRRGR